MIDKVKLIHELNFLFETHIFFFVIFSSFYYFFSWLFVLFLDLHQLLIKDNYFSSLFIHYLCKKCNLVYKFIYLLFSWDLISFSQFAIFTYFKKRRWLLRTAWWEQLGAIEDFAIIICWFIFVTFWFFFFTVLCKLFA